MFNTLSLFNVSKVTTVLLLLVVLLLVFPGQAAGLGHDARLQEVSGLNGESAVISARVESPDMVLARLASEGVLSTPVTRVESPDMFLARRAIEQTGTAAPTAVGPEATGNNYLALILILAASVILSIAVMSWGRLFKQSEADLERIKSRCTLVSESC